MKSMIFHLVLKDLARDAKSPIGIIIMTIMPIILALIIASIFADNNSSGTPNITIHIALYDQDDNILGNWIKGMSNQGGDGGNIIMHPVDGKEEGLLMLENRKASAFLVLPENMTEDILNNATSTIQIYKNPAETMMPVVVEKGVDVFTTGISQAVNLLGSELKVMKDMIETEEFPDTWTTAMLMYNGLNKIKSLETYIFPPIIQYDSINAHDFVPSASQTITAEAAS